MTALTPSLTIALSIFQRYAVGDTIEERFRNCVTREHVSEACFMTTNEDEQFRAAVGAVMLSYGVGSPEFERIEAEMTGIQKFSAYLRAAGAGLNVEPPDIESTEQPIGLLGLWHARSK